MFKTDKIYVWPHQLNSKETVLISRYCLLLVCLGFCPTQECFAHMETVEGLKNQCWIIIYIHDHWGFFSVPCLLWHGASVYLVQPDDPWYSHVDYIYHIQYQQTYKNPINIFSWLKDQIPQILRSST